MIELIAAAVTGAVAGGGVAGGMVWLTARCMVSRANNHWNYRYDKEWRRADRGWDKLYALRANCFIPDERGVKVRYSDASVARRLKAETPKDAV